MGNSDKNYTSEKKRLNLDTTLSLNNISEESETDILLRKLTNEAEVIKNDISKLDERRDKILLKIRRLKNKGGKLKSL